MEYLLDAAQMKAADTYTIRELGIPSMELMERAASSCVRAMEQVRWQLGRVLIVCGSGNNGGDGFAIGRILLEKGTDVTMVFAGRMESRTEETICQMERFEQAGGKVRDTLEPEEYDIVVDALFGVGLSRDITGNYLNIINNMNTLEGKKLAVDIPSGISASTGCVMGIAFQADMTVTFQEKKLGLCLYPGCGFAGKVVVSDIGIDSSSVTEDSNICYTIDEKDAAEMLPGRPEDSNKGTFGKLLLIAGSKGMAGAAFLSAYAAYRMGAGLVQIYTVEDNRSILQQLIPEAIIAAYEEFDPEELKKKLAWADAVCIGPGIGISEISKHILNTVLKEGKVPCMIDADGLNLLTSDSELMGKLSEGSYVLTPHMKELSRLTGQSIEFLKINRRKALDSFTEQYGVTLVQKDARTLVGEYGHHTYVNRTGNAAMAKAGSGDVLSGMIAGLMAQGKTPYESAVLGVYLHGLAGDLAREKLGDYSVLARDLAEHIGSAVLTVKKVLKTAANERTEYEAKTIYTSLCQN